MTDPDLRALLRPHLPAGLVIDELELRGGAMGHALTVSEMESAWASVRADVVVVGDFLHGYEIKSAADSLARLPRQVKAYSAVFDFCTLVTEPRHLAAALPLLPPWWGVLVADGVALRTHRLAERHAPEPGPLVRMLWKSEVQALYRAHRIPFGARDNAHVLWQRVGDVPLPALRAAVRAALVLRCGPGGRRARLKRERAAHAAAEKLRVEKERAFMEKLAAREEARRG